MVHIRRTLNELEDLVNEQLKASDPEGTIDWLARLLVVRSCGYLEQVMREVSHEIVEQGSGGRVRSFAISWIFEGRNPSPPFMLEWLGRFDQQFADDLGRLLDANDEELRREIHFLVDRRGKIAHGLNEGIGPLKALQLKQDACKVAEWILANCKP